MSRILATITTQIRVVFVGEGGTIIGFAEDLMADRWLELLLGSDATTWTGLIASVLGDGDLDRMASGLQDGTIGHRSVVSAARDLLTAAGGRDWWQVLAILEISDVWWDVIGGELALKGIIPARVTLGTWLDAAWLLIRRAAAQQSEELLNEVVSAVTSQPLESGQDTEMTFEEFMSASAGRHGPLPRPRSPTSG